jgi:hypothetical protein
MHDLDRIEHALATSNLDHSVFERCAQDLLSSHLPGLTPIPGGTDWGRDADVSSPIGDVAIRVLATTSRTLEGVTDNMRRGIKSLKAHGVSVDRVVLANPAVLSMRDRHKISSSAATLGARLDVADIFDRGYFASKLRRDDYWREKLLGLPSLPVSFSRTPSDLAESPWAMLTLVGRENELGFLADSVDSIIYGVPGSGKSRLLAEFREVAFLDKRATREQIAADLRWVAPTIVAVDDASRAIPTVEYLAQLRRTEPDIFTYRIVCSCWPQDLSALQELLPAATATEVTLLEREPIDALLREMGIASQFAREEILRQAEGRPGWAVTLADILLRAGEPQQVFQGAALFGQVERFIKRSGADVGSLDALAVVALLGAVTELEVRALADELGVSRELVAERVERCATGGLVDVASRWDGEPRRKVRVYSVRPPMLAVALVGARIFNSTVPPVDIYVLPERWPDHIVDIANVTINTVRRGTHAARHVAGHLFRVVMGSGKASSEEKISVARLYCTLGPEAGSEVIEIVRHELDRELRRDEVEHPSRLEPLTALAATCVRYYKNVHAMDVLFNVCAVDARVLHPNPGHPARLVAELVQTFHPEAPIDMELRAVLTARFVHWFRVSDVQSPAAIREITSEILSLGLRCSFPDPGRPHVLSIYEMILPPRAIETVYADIWGLLCTVDFAQHPGVCEGMLTALGQWLRIGNGYDRPFGLDHPQDRITMALRIARRAVQDIVSRDDLSVGLRARFNSIAGRHDLDIDTSLPADLACFFEDVHRNEVDDYIAAEQEVVRKVSSQAEQWIDDEPSNVVAKLSQLRVELAYTHTAWPNRILVACEAIAKRSMDCARWAKQCIQHGLLPEGCAFIEEMATRGALSTSIIEEFLAQPAGRSGAIHVVLASANVSNEIFHTVASNLTVHDFEVVRIVILRKQLSLSRVRALLKWPDKDVRALAAVALFCSGRPRDRSIPDELRDEWRAAVVSSDITKVPLARHETAELANVLVQSYPSEFTDVVERAISSRGSNELAYEKLPSEFWEALSQLPSAHKLELLRKFRSDPTIANFIQCQVVGRDFEWIASALDSGIIDSYDVISAFSNLDDNVNVEQLARVLVPRGVEASQVASVLMYGSWVGEESQHYGKIVQRFQSMMHSDDGSVRAVAKAGVEIFEQLRDEAAEKERIARIRGDL